MASPTQAEIFPVLGRLCLALGEGRAYRLWSLLSQWNRDYTGSGSVFLSYQDADALGLTGSRSLARTLTTALQLGYISGFVTLDGSGWRVFLSSAKRLNRLVRARAEAAAIGEFYERERGKVYIPLADFADWQTFCGAIFDSWIAVRPDQSMRISGVELERLWGKCRQTVSSWRNAAKRTTRVTNWGSKDISTSAEPDPTFDPEYSHGFTGDYKGSPVFIYRRSNTYISNAPRAARGVTRKFSRYGVQPDSSGVVGQTYQSWDTDGPTPTGELWRSNFHDYSAFIRAHSDRRGTLHYLASRIKRGASPVSQMWVVSVAI